MNPTKEIQMKTILSLVLLIVLAACGTTDRVYIDGALADAAVLKMFRDPSMPLSDGPYPDSILNPKASQ